MDSRRMEDIESARAWAGRREGMGGGGREGGKKGARVERGRRRIRERVREVSI